MQEKEQEDEQDKVKDKDQEYGYDQEYELTSAVCLLISYKLYMFFNCFLGKGSKIKLIIFAEFSAKGYPPPLFCGK